MHKNVYPNLTGDSCMEKRFLLAGLAILLIPACGCRKERDHVRHVVCKEEPACIETFVQPMCESEQVIMPSRKPHKTSRPTSEDIEGFAFEEQGNTFKLLDEEGVAPQQGTPEERDAWFDERTEQAQKHGFKTIYFGYGEYALQPDQQAALEHNLKKISAATKKGTVIVEGHACNFGGSHEYNMHLSHDRAKAVKRFLVDRGVAEDKLEAVGRGNEMRIVLDGDKEQQAPNRRVEFYLKEGDTKEPQVITLAEPSE